METKTKLLIGFLILLISSSIIYVTFSDKARIRVDEDKTTFYVLNENNRFEVAGREFNYLFDGTTKLYRDVSNIEVKTWNDSTKVWIQRITPYKRGPIIIDTYEFDGSVSDIELFPINHTVEIFNGTSYFYKYSVKDLTYDGPTFKLDGKQTFMSFGKNMKVTWWEDYRLGWVYKSGSMYVKSEKLSDYEKFDVRLFDPIGCGVINTAGVQTLTSNLQSNGTCFTINVSNVLIDCDNFNITGNQTGYGIYSKHSLSTELTNVSILNCVVSNYSKGVYYYNTTYSKIENNTLSFNIDNGLLLNKYSNYNNITGNVANNVSGGSDDVGIYLAYNSDYNLIDNNTCNYNNLEGIKTYRAYNNTISNNIANFNGHIGIYVQNNIETRTDTIITNNIVKNNTWIGIKTKFAENVDITHNTIKFNCNGSIGDSEIDTGGKQLYIWGSGHSYVLNNTIDCGNILDTTGIYPRYGDYHQIINNTIINCNTSSAASSCAMYLHVNNYNNVTGNNMTDNEYGISGYNASNGLIWNNIFKDNKYGIHPHLSYNLQIYNENVQSSRPGCIALWFSATNNSYVNDTVLNCSSSTDEIHVSGVGYTSSVVNVTHDRTKVNVIGANSTLNVYYYLNVYVNDTAGNDMASINVSGKDIREDVTFSVLTDANGDIAQQTLLEYSEMNSVKNFSTNYIIWAYNLTDADQEDVNLTESKSIILTVDVVDLLVEYGVGTGTNNTFILPTQSNVYVNVTVTEINGITAIKEANITFGLFNKTSTVNETVFTDFTRIINWTGLNKGMYFYNVTIWDYANKINNTETRTINLLVDFNVSISPNMAFEFLPDNSTHQQVEPTNQTNTTGILTLHNNLSYDSSIQLIFNESFGNISVWINDAYNYSNATEINTTSYYEIITNLSIDSTTYLWFWADYLTPLNVWFPAFDIYAKMI